MDKAILVTHRMTFGVIIKELGQGLLSLFVARVRNSLDKAILVTNSIILVMIIKEFGYGYLFLFTASTSF